MFVCIHHDNDVVWWRQSGTRAEVSAECQRWSGGGDGGGGATAEQQRRSRSGGVAAVMAAEWGQWRSGGSVEQGGRGF